MRFIFRFVQALLLGWICVGNSMADSGKVFSFLNTQIKSYHPSFSPTSSFSTHIYTVRCLIKRCLT
jgi:hypothetical protein